MFVLLKELIPFSNFHVTFAVQGNVFTPVCHSVHRGRGCLADTPQADIPPRQTPPRADTPILGRPPEQTPLPGRHPSPPGRHPCLPETATAADGTHPTGMHSCNMQFYQGGNFLHELRG